MDTIEEKLDYNFKSQSLLINALTHSSYANENRGRSCESNERLEFLGDSVLGLVVADALYRRFPEMPEGRMTRMRAQLVCEESLHRVASELGLGEYMRLGRGEERHRRQEPHEHTGRRGGGHYSGDVPRWRYGGCPQLYHKAHTLHPRRDIHIVWRQ